MAKLDSNGTELLRVTLEKGIGTVEWDRTIKSFRSNGWVLVKRDCAFEDRYSPNGVRKHSYGWKKAYRAKDSLTPGMLADMYLRKGWIVEYLTGYSADKPINVAGTSAKRVAAKVKAKVRADKAHAERVRSAATCDPFALVGMAERAMASCHVGSSVLRLVNAVVDRLDGRTREEKWELWKAIPAGTRRAALSAAFARMRAHRATYRDVMRQDIPMDPRAISDGIMALVAR